MPQDVARVHKAAYGPFCDALDRLQCLTLTQLLIARFLGKATLQSGVNSLRYSSLDELTRLRPHSRPFCGWGKNDLSPALNALAGYGIIRLEERAALETGLPEETVLQVMASSRDWTVDARDWRCTPAEEEEWRLHLASLGRRGTRHLEGLGEDPDLHDARAALSAEEAARHQRDAIGASAGSAGDGETKEVVACRREPFPPRDAVAPTGVPPVSASAPPPVRSGIQNAETPAKSRCVPDSGTPRAGARPIGKGIGKELETVQNWSNPNWRVDSEMRETLRLKLSSGDEREWAWAAQQIIGEHDWKVGSIGRPFGDGAVWRKRYRHGPSRATVLAVLADMLATAAEINTTPAAYAEDLWRRFGGRALDIRRLAAPPEKSKESF